MRTLVVLLTLSAVVFPDSGVSYQGVDPFCGNVLSKDGNKFQIQGAWMDLYEARVKNVPCCKQAQKIRSLKLKKNGAFDLRAQNTGFYFLVINSKQGSFSVPVWWEAKNSGHACSNDLYSTIELNPSTGTAEVLTHVTNHQDATP